MKVVTCNKLIGNREKNMCGCYSYVYCATSFVINWLKWVATRWTRNAVVYINVCLWNLMYVHLKIDVKIQKALVNRNFGTVDFPFLFLLFSFFFFDYLYILCDIIFYSFCDKVHARIQLKIGSPHPKASWLNKVLNEHAYNVITKYQKLYSANIKYSNTILLIGRWPASQNQCKPKWSKVGYFAKFTHA